VPSKDALFKGQGKANKMKERTGAMTRIVIVQLVRTVRRQRVSCVVRHTDDSCDMHVAMLASHRLSSCI